MEIPHEPAERCRRVPTITRHDERLTTHPCDRSPENRRGLRGALSPLELAVARQFRGLAWLPGDPGASWWLLRGVVVLLDIRLRDSQKCARNQRSCVHCE